MKLVGYEWPTSLCVKIEFVFGTISFSCEFFSLSKAAFFHVGPAQLCSENGVSIYMCSAVEVAWLAQNIRHSNTRVWLHLHSLVATGGFGGFIPPNLNMKHYNLGEFLSNLNVKPPC